MTSTTTSSYFIPKTLKKNKKVNYFEGAFTQRIRIYWSKHSRKDKVVQSKNSIE